MPPRADLLQGTLDLLILKTLALEAAHGWGIAQRIEQVSNNVLQVGQGSLYPALHRLEEKGGVTAKWETAPNRNRQFKYYRLTATGRKQLLQEDSRWKKMAQAVSRIMWPEEA